MMGAFDPYPFILLNLVLSCIAALQAPVIMMSQKRQEEKDRQRSENDYRINLKAELEIRHLHEKIDHMLTGNGSGWRRFRQSRLSSWKISPAGDIRPTADSFPIGISYTSYLVRKS